MKKRKLTFILILLIIILGLIYYLSSAHNNILSQLFSGNISAITDFIRSFEILSPLALILLVILEVVFAPIPPLILYITSGIIFGPLLGGILVLFGNIIGAAIAFYIAKTFGENYLSEKISKKQKQRFYKLTEKYSFLAIFLLRINPITSSDIFSYLAGLSKMKISKFLLSTSLGLAPLIFIQTYLGSYLTENPLLFNTFVIVSIIYLFLFIYLVLAPKRQG